MSPGAIKGLDAFAGIGAIKGLDNFAGLGAISGLSNFASEMATQAKDLNGFGKMFADQALSSFGSPGAGTAHEWLACTMVNDQITQAFAPLQHRIQGVGAIATQLAGSMPAIPTWEAIEPTALVPRLPALEETQVEMATSLDDLLEEFHARHERDADLRRAEEERHRRGERRARRRDWIRSVFIAAMSAGLGAIAQRFLGGG